MYEANQDRIVKALEDLVVVAKETKIKIGERLHEIDLSLTNIGDHIDSIDSTLEECTKGEKPALGFGDNVPIHETNNGARYIKVLDLLKKKSVQITLKDLSEALDWEEK